METNPDTVPSTVTEEEKKLLEIPHAQTPDKDKKPNEPVKKLPPDGGYGWVVLAASFSISIILDAIMYSWGILLEPIKDYYEVNNQKANLLTSIYTGFFLISGPLVSGLIDQFGCRVAIMGGAFVTSLMFFISVFSPNIYVMYITIGFVGGVSTGVFYLASLIIIPEYFDKKKGIATGITMAGSGIGFFVGPPILEKTIKAYGWKITMAGCGAAILVNAFIGILSKPLNPSKSSLKLNKKKEKKIVEQVNVEIMSGSIVSLKKVEDEQSFFIGLIKEMTNFSLLRQNWKFTLITLSNFAIFTGYFIPFIFVKKIAGLNNIPNPAYFISIIGVVNIPGRLLSGFLADKRWLKPVTYNTLAALIGVVPLMLHDCYLQKYYWTQCLFATLYALSTSGLVTLCTPYLCDIVGLEKFGNAMGIVNLFRGVGCFIGPYIGGLIADKYSMVKSFYFCGGCYFVGFIFSAAVSFSKDKKSTKTDAEAVEK